MSQSAPVSALPSVGAAIGFFACEKLTTSRQSEPTPTPTPTPVPTPQVQLAPEGVFFVLKAFSVQHEHGVHGFPVLNQVRLVREEGNDLVVTDGQSEARAPKSDFTNDLDVVDRLRQSLLLPQVSLPSAGLSPMGLEIDKGSSDIVRANSNVEKLESALGKVDSRMSKLNERIGRGEAFDGLTDLRELNKELEKDRAKLESELQYWREMSDKLTRYQWKLEESQRATESVSNRAEGAERTRQDAARAQAEVMSSGAAVNAHCAAQPR